MADSLRLDPWCFGNDGQNFPSPDYKQWLEYDTLSEFGQGSPVHGPCYWVTANGARTLLHKRCGGPPVWDNLGCKVALPLWERHWFRGFIARIGVLDITTAELTILAPRFRVLHLQSFDDLIVRGIDSPIWQPKDLAINIAATAKRVVYALR